MNTNTREAIYLVPALTRGFAILDLLAREPGLNFTAIQARLGLPKSSTFNLLLALCHLGAVRQDEEGLYALGFKLYELGSCVLDSSSLTRVALPHLRKLSQELQLTTHLGVRESHEAIYLARVECNSEIVVKSWVGRRFAINRSALGKVLVAWLPPAEIEEILGQLDWERKTPKTLANPRALHADLTLVRARGWAIDDEEEIHNVRCIAAPLRDPRGRTVAAISAVGTVMTVTDGNFETLGSRVSAVAEEISRSLFAPAETAGAEKKRDGGRNARIHGGPAGTPTAPG